MVPTGRRRILWAARRDLISGPVRELARDGIAVFEEPDGHRAIERLFTESFDAAIIDLELPPFDDFTVVRSWRLDDIPIITITSEADASDAIAALEMGADDYLRKPYLKAELRARLRALLRRTAPPPVPQKAAHISVGALTIHPDTFQVWKRGVEISLSVTEFKLLLALASEPGRAMSREMLVRKAWGYEFLGSSRLVDMTIARLRGKIEDRPKQPEYVVTRRGVGYVFRVPRPSLTRLLPSSHPRPEQPGPGS